MLAPGCRTFPNFLFENQDQHDLNKVIDDLKNMLKSSNRIIRKRAFEYIAGHDDVILSTGDDINDWYREQYM